MSALHPCTRADGGEAGLTPVEERRKVLAARLLGPALALPPTDSLRETAEATAPSRLSSVRGWQTKGRQMLAEAEVTPPIEPILPPRIPPWEHGGDVSFRLHVGLLRVGATQEEKVRSATQHLSSTVRRLALDGWLSGRRRQEWWLWSGDHMAVRRGGGVEDSSWTALLQLQRGDIRPGDWVEHLLDYPRDRDTPIVTCMDCMASLAIPREGPTAQKSPLGTAVWRVLSRPSQ